MNAILKSGDMSRVPPVSPKPLRILIVSDAWEPQVNGVVRTYQNLISVWRALGHKVLVMGPADFATIPLPGYNEISLALFPYARLSRRIAEFAPDLVHIGVEGPLGWAARRHCLRHGLSFSTAFHTNFPAYIALRAPKMLRAPMERLALAHLRRFHNAASHVFVATPSLERQLRDWGFRGPFVQLSRGVDTAQFFPAPPRPASECPVLLYVGRIAPEKSLDSFLALTERELGPHRKIVVGDGPDLPALRKTYPDAIFRGTLEGQALAEAYREADVFVFPSRTDTFGMVLIEALACGLPIAAHHAPGPRDIVTDASLGALDDDLAQAILRAVRAPGSRALRNAHAISLYDWAAVAQQFLTPGMDAPLSIASWGKAPTPRAVAAKQAV